MRVLVTGGRDYKNRQKVYIELDKIHEETPITLLIHGGANGTDQLADDWAKLNEVPSLRHPAKWKTGEAGKGEGSIRNGKMLDWKPDILLVFPGSRGTRDMWNQAKVENAKRGGFIQNKKIEIRDLRNET